MLGYFVGLIFGLLYYKIASQLFFSWLFNSIGLNWNNLKKNQMKDKENCQFVSSLVSRIFGQVVANLFFIHISHIYQVWDFKIQYFSLIQPWNFSRNWRTLTGKPLLYSFLEKNKAKLGITPTIRERLMNRVTRHKKSDRWNFICALNKFYFHLFVHFQKLSCCLL